MAKLVIMITAQIEKGVQVAEAWEKAGAPGVTMLDSYGLHHLRERSKGLELPLFVSMASVMRQIEQTNITLLSVVDTDIVDKLLDAASGILGSLSEPHTGVAFVLDVERIVGIPNFPHKGE
jgi:nitrogen regulatory protein PII